MTTKFSHILLLVALLAFCACSEKDREKSGTSPGSNPNPTEEGTAAKPNEQSAEVVQDAWTKYENNPAASESKFRNKMLEASGKVTDIVKLKDGPNKGKWVLALVSESNPKKGMTRCLFEHADDLEPTGKGKVARIHGRFDSWNPEQHCLYLRDCVLK
jgi:hypothetical protein